MKKNKIFSFRTSEENLEYVEKVAKEDDRSVSWVIDKMIKYFKNNNSPKDTIKKIR